MLPTAVPFEGSEINLRFALGYVWDTNTLQWIKDTGGGTGGGGAVTVADGADVAQGSVSDVAWVSGDGTVISLLKKIASAGGSAVSIADGSDVAEGTTTDAAVVTDTTGTLSGKMRGLVKWAFERMPASLGQKAMTASLPVVIASDQSAVTVTGTVTATTGGLTDVQLRATPVPVSGTLTVNTGLTDAQLRATPVPVSGTLTVNTGLTDAQLRATAVPVSMGVTDLTPSSPTAATVGVASAQAVAAAATRKGLVLTNTSNARISLGFGSAAVLDSGITLYPGGVFEMDSNTFDVGAVNAIASAAASNLAIQEYTT